jgi:hypothetical protein
MEQPSLPLRVVDGLELGDELQAVLRPDEPFADPQGRERRLPRYFYEVASWQDALEMQITPHFCLWEFLDVDVREAEVMRTFPRYVPCAVTLLAGFLELFRQEVGTFVHISANGGYRSPAHALNRHATTHAWATAVNIYRIGDDWLDDQDEIERYIRVARRVLPGIWSRPYGSGAGFADDHLHLDLGYVTVVPHEIGNEGGGDDTREA